MKNTVLFNDDIKQIMLSDEYWRMLKSIGFSKEFILYERIRKQKECINYLLNQYRYRQPDN